MFKNVETPVGRVRGLIEHFEGRDDSQTSQGKKMSRVAGRVLFFEGLAKRENEEKKPWPVNRGSA